MKRSPMPARKSSMRRSRSRATSRKATGIPPGVRDDVRLRSSGFCEAARANGSHADQFCRGIGEQMHHKLRRGQGGEHTAANLLHVSSSCHDFIHAHPAEAYAHGWLIRSHTDQAEDTE